MHSLMAIARIVGLLYPTILSGILVPAILCSVRVIRALPKNLFRVVAQRAEDAKTRSWRRGEPDYGGVRGLTERRSRCRCRA